MSAKKWTCPHCGLEQLSTDDNRHRAFETILVGQTKYRGVGLVIEANGCLNQDCRDVSIDVHLVNAQIRFDGPRRLVTDSTSIRKMRLHPFGFSKPQPDFIPVALVNDYVEACLIRDLSPKASATLSRRCLQGMIRDFCGIAKGRLIEEIKELKARVAAGNAPAGVMAETVEAIDYVRSVGNIGAHMEKDINLVVDVDPDEAQTLIDLIELLFAEWYVARKKREDRLAAVKHVAGTKAAAKAGNGNAMKP
jgi:hypothetical protein